MAVQVGYGFTRVRAIIENQAKARLIQSQLLGHFGSLQQQMTENLMVFRPGFGEAGNGFLRHDQNVRWGLGFDVMKRQH